MKSLIKWAGGKSREIKKIKEIIPEFDRYIEPFFGGGALFFELEPSKAVINDTSQDLIDFYKTLKGNKSREKLKIELYKYVSSWEKVKIYMQFFGRDFIYLHKEYRSDKLNKEEVSNRILDLFQNKIISFNGLFKKSFCINSKILSANLRKSLLNKIDRIKKIERKFGIFSDEQLSNHIETAFRSGFYNHFRDILNLSKKGRLDISKEKEIANYYFIREFCYGSMFRFNRDGDFNIPYGGIAYNNKNWKKKIDELFSDKLEKIFNGTSIYNLDFEELLNKISLTSKDFIFLDPPYYCEFSEYDNNSFNENDHKRLAKYLSHLKTNFIMIIKEDSFIRKLYEKIPSVNIASFEKTYLCNMRGRNDRKVTHLIIKNF
ncbi:MAG: DNA adenine methylase [Candidatus Pacearchaeota archaeon]